MKFGAMGLPPQYKLGNQIEPPNLDDTELGATPNCPALEFYRGKTGHREKKAMICPKPQLIKLQEAGLKARFYDSLSQCFFPLYHVVPWPSELKGSGMNT